MSVIEPSDAVNAGMATQTEGRRPAPQRKSPSSVSSLVGWLVGWLKVKIQDKRHDVRTTDMFDGFQPVTSGT